ncbi:hypothetical protein BJ508DRAFT_326272 [Ascobolus immersus RN42]|uniref:Uncharacterized protein n=1 Tax=Ascobolus immersus RN42 TaxID=1160509 RepID=A0A3N4I670_ASCIM|nr:hypothetical protein BJ508DRAFT_326272 [Ascobolus immersus RN42]
MDFVMDAIGQCMNEFSSCDFSAGALCVLVKKLLAEYVVSLGDRLRERFALIPVWHDPEDLNAGEAEKDPLREVLASPQHRQDLRVIHALQNFDTDRLETLLVILRGTFKGSPFASTLPEPHEDSRPISWGWLKREDQDIYTLPGSQLPGRDEDLDNV